jgi:hypothetical protein
MVEEGVFVLNNPPLPLANVRTQWLIYTTALPEEVLMEAETNFPGTRSKTDQQREFYLGHSVKAATGRWQKGKDIFWYQKEKDPLHSLSNEDAIAQERAMAKQREEALMKSQTKATRYWHKCH